jgi:hypothetical protein
MPFAARLRDEDQNKNGVNISGGAGANFATGIPGQEGSKDRKSSGQYANIQQYLEANKGQAQQMGQTVTQNVDQSASDAQSKTQAFAAQAPKVEAYDPNSVYSKLGSLSDEEKSQYKQQKTTGGYSGPQSIDQVSGYAELQKAQMDAQNKLRNASTEAGQQELLRTIYDKGNYTGGQNKLDQVLLQNNADSRAGLENLTQKYSGLAGLFGDTAKNVGQSISSAVSQAAQNRQNVAAGEQQAWNSLINPIQTRADQMNRDNPAFINRITEDAADHVLNEETLAELGLSPGSHLWGLNLGSYLQPNMANVGLNEAASAEERAKYRDLADLSGDPTRTQITDNAQQIDPMGFNSQQFNQDLAQSQAFFENLARNQKYAASQRANYDNGAWRDYTAEVNVYDWLQQNPGALSGNALDYKYPDIGITDFAGTVPDPEEGQNPIIQKIGRIGDPELQPVDINTSRAISGVKSSLYDQIMSFLNSQNYNRVIEKG